MFGLLIVMKKIIIPVVVIIIGAFGALAYKSLNKNEKIPLLLDRQVSDSEVSEWKEVKRQVEELHASLRRNPGDNTSRLKLAEIFINEGKSSGKHYYYYSAAQNLLNFIIESSSNVDAVRTKAMLHKASLLLSLNQFEQALEVCIALSYDGYDSLFVNEMKFEALLGIGDYERAKEIAELMRRTESNLKMYTRLARLCEIKGDLKGAKDFLLKGLSVDASDQELVLMAKYKMGCLFEQEGDLRTAEEIFKGILAIDSGEAFAKSGMARIMVKNKKYAEAVHMLEEAYKVNPLIVFKEDIARTYKIAGRMNDARKEVQDIVNDLEEGEKTGCNYDLIRANIYCEILEDYDLALIYAERARSRWPENVDLNKLLAIIYYKVGDNENAELYLKKAAQVQENNPQISCLSGLLKYKSGEVKEGISIMKKSVPKLNFYYCSVAFEAEDLIAKNDISLSVK